MEIAEMKNMLKEVETITFSKHFYDEKVKLRGINEEEIETYLKSPDKLIAVEDQGEELKGHKYALLFSKSNKYDLKVVVSVKDLIFNPLYKRKQSTPSFNPISEKPARKSLTEVI